MRADIPYDSRIWRDMPDGAYEPTRGTSSFTSSLCYMSHTLMDSARWLISRLLCKNSSARCTMKEALASSWIIKQLSMLEKRYQINILATADA